MIPRFGDSPFPAQTYKRRPGVYAILPRGASVLLTVQQDAAWDVQLPGGGIDPGEHPIAALHREVLEETGWRIAAPRRLGTFRRFAFMPEYDLWAEKLCHIYTARPVRQLHAPLEPNHVETWMPISEAITVLGNDGDRHFLQRYDLLSGLYSNKMPEISSGKA